MKADWRQLRRGDTSPRAAGYYATMNRWGVIMINKTTHERMDAPEAVHILYDAVNNRIGLKLTSRALRDAYPLAARADRGGRYLRAFRLLSELGIELPATVEFQKVEIDQDGVLILDLRQTRVSGRAEGWVRARAKKEKQQRAAAE